MESVSDSCISLHCHRKAFKDNLAAALTGAIESSPELHYTQGLNSVGATVLLGEGPEKCRLFLRRFLAWHGSPYCRASLKETNAVLGVLDTLIVAMDPEYGALMRSQPLLSLHMYALDSVMTWFSHASPSAEIGCQWHRLLSARHPLMVVYAVAVLTVSKRDLVLREFAAADSMAIAGPVHMILKQYPLGVHPSEVMAVADAWALKLPPRDLLLASSEDTRDALMTVPALWADDSDIPNIWPSEASAEDGEAADAGVPPGLGSKAMAMSSDVGAVSRASSSAKTARLSRLELAECVNAFSPAPTTAVRTASESPLGSIAGSAGLILAALLVATLAAHWASEASTGESVVISGLSNLLRLTATGPRMPRLAASVSPERDAFTGIATIVAAVVKEASTVVSRGVSLLARAVR